MSSVLDGMVALAVQEDMDGAGSVWQFCNAMDFNVNLVARVQDSYKFITSSLGKFKRITIQQI